MHSKSRAEIDDQRARGQRQVQLVEFGFAGVERRFGAPRHPCIHRRKQLGVVVGDRAHAPGAVPAACAAAAGRARDAELLHAMTQRCGFHAELERGAMIAFDDPVRGIEHPQDVLALDVMQPGVFGVIEIDRRLCRHQHPVHARGCRSDIGAPVGRIRRQNFRRDLEQRRGIQDERAFDEVFQFAHVAGPGIPRECGERVGVHAIDAPAHARRVFLREELQQHAGCRLGACAAAAVRSERR